MGHDVPSLLRVQSCRQPPRGQLDLFLIFNFFFLIEQIPSGYFWSASYSIFGAGNKSILFGACGGPRAEPLQRECKAAGSDVPVIVRPCVSAPHCPEAALNRQAQRPPFKVGTPCSIRRPAFASALFPAHTQVSSQGRGTGLEVGFLLPCLSLPLSLSLSVSQTSLSSSPHTPPPQSLLLSQNL